MRRFPIALLLLGALPGLAGTIVLTDDSRGWVTPNPAPPPGGVTTGDAPPNNGTSAGNSYAAGLSLGFGQFRDWFEFDIPSLPGLVTSATLSLDQPAGTVAVGIPSSTVGHFGPQTTYTLYGLPSIPTGFSDFLNGSVYGSATLDSTSNGTVVDIALDAAAIDAIAAAGGDVFLLGGIDSGEIIPAVCNGCGQNFDFANTDGASVTLTLDVSGSPFGDAPEPSTGAALVTAGALFLVRAIVRRP